MFSGRIIRRTLRDAGSIMTSPSLFTVTSEADGTRLESWLKRQIPGVPYGLWQKLLRKGAIKINGKKAKSGQRLEAGQEVRIPAIDTQKTPNTKKKHVSDSDIDLWLRQNILYQDKHIIVINKPAGLATQGGSKVKISVDAMLDALATTREGERIVPKLVHRLDKDTSGALLLARSAQMARILTEGFRDKTIEKAYWALVAGVPAQKQGTIRLPLSPRRAAGNTEKMMVDEEEGKPSITHYRIVEKAGKEMAWLELYPETGRKHQLRVHLAAIGHPIIGDGKYGGSEAFMEGIEPSLHLHAQHIIVPDIKGKTLEISAPLPPHMKRSWKWLGFDLEKTD